ncbi:MAG: hypothetical protein QNJ15_09725 [Erythrobacter sp.]|nr:hypothetical protein [Erythrobacter sp.]
MRKTTTYLIAASLAVSGATAPSALIAQDETPIEEVSLTEEQQAVYDGWAPDQQVAYNSWPSETKNYFWTLSDKRQALFWRLTDEDKLAITAMTGPEREKAWSGIEAAAGGEAAAETGADERIN